MSERSKINAVGIIKTENAPKVDIAPTQPCVEGRVWVSKKETDLPNSNVLVKQMTGVKN